jgi:hypothetical protein
MAIRSGRIGWLAGDHYWMVVYLGEIIDLRQKYRITKTEASLSNTSTMYKVKGNVNPKAVCFYRGTS